MQTYEWISTKQLLQFGLEIIVRVDAVLKVCKYAELSIELVGTDSRAIHPRASQSQRSELRHLWKTAVPYAGMVSYAVAKKHDTLYPTFQDLMLRKIELPRYLLLYPIVIQIAEPLRQYAE